MPRLDLVPPESPVQGGSGGLLSRWYRGLREALLPAAEPASIAYRQMSRLIDREFDRREGGTCLAFASPDSDDAGAGALLMLAYCLHTELDGRVLLVDARLKDKSGGITGRLGLAQAPGFAEAIRDGLEGREHLITGTAVPGVDVLPAGDPSGRATAMDGGNLRKLLEAARSRYGHVLVHVGSPLRDTRAVMTALEARAVFVLVEENRTFVRTLDECRKVLLDNGARDVRVVVTGAGP